MIYSLQHCPHILNKILSIVLLILQSSQILLDWVFSAVGKRSTLLLIRWHHRDLYIRPELRLHHRERDDLNRLNLAGVRSGLQRCTTKYVRQKQHAIYHVNDMKGKA
jgi:hypothetical protein